MSRLEQIKRQLAKGENMHLVYEACKTLELEGSFEGLNPDEQLQLLQSSLFGVSVGTILEGWREYESAKLGRRNSA